MMKDKLAEALVMAHDVLQEDILNRYNNMEYWDLELVEEELGDAGYSQEAIKEVLKEIK